ncbi:MAG: P-II family nitrogen regulator [Bryobacteraceae bacterium]
MKEIKAYVKRDCINNLVDQLEKAGAPGITIVEIHPVGYGYDPNYFGFHAEDVFQRYKHLRIVKVEVVCADADLQQLLDVIRGQCSTGAKGDGMIFVSEVVRSVRIRDGGCGEEAL